MNDHDQPAIQASIAPWLSVSDVQQAIDYYKAAFGAGESYRLEDDGRIVVAHLAIGQADFWVQDDPDAGSGQGKGPIRLILTVDDPDEVFGQAVAAGATVVEHIAEDHGWRIGRLADPFGHHWEVGRQLPDQDG